MSIVETCRANQGAMMEKSDVYADSAERNSISFAHGFEMAKLAIFVRGNACQRGGNIVPKHLLTVSARSVARNFKSAKEEEELDNIARSPAWRKLADDACEQLTIRNGKAASLRQGDLMLSVSALRPKNDGWVDASYADQQKNLKAIIISIRTRSLSFAGNVTANNTQN